MKWLRKLFRPKAIQPTINENVPATVTAVPGGYRCVPDKPTLLSNGEITVNLDAVVQSILHDLVDKPDLWTKEFSEYSTNTTYYKFKGRNHYTLAHHVTPFSDVVNLLSMTEDDFTNQQQSQLRNAIRTWEKNRTTVFEDCRKRQSLETLTRIFPGSVIQKP